MTSAAVQDVTRALAVLHDQGDTFEIRILNTRRGTVSGWFNDPVKAANAAAQWDGKKNVYITMNPCDPALLARAENRLQEYAKQTTSDANITRRRWMLIDIDPQRPAGISATDAEKTAARETAENVRAHLTGRGWTEPVFADSGNGYHILYRIDLPNDTASRDIIKACLEVLSLRFDSESVTVDTSVHNAARIIKTYGTLSCKGDSTADRPHRRSGLLEIPSTVEPVTVDLLHSLAAELPKPERPALTLASGTGARFDLQAFIEKAGMVVRQTKTWQGGMMYVLQECPFDAGHDKDSCIIESASGALAFKCLHNSCSHNNWRELRLKFEPDAYDKPAGTGAGKKKRSAAAPARVAMPGARRGSILITNRFMREITSDTLHSLNAANSPPELFKTGNEIVRISPADLAEPLSVSALRGRMDRIADYLKFDKNGEEVPARPPMDVAQDILSLPASEIPFPELRGVRHAPLFLQDGRLLCAEGYDPASGWQLRLRGLNGIRADIPLIEAKRWLDDLVCDFPFADESSRTHAIALLLQPFVRELITSPTPCYLIDAPARGTGKGLLGEVATVVPTGGAAPVMSLVGDGDEVEKRITSLLLGGRSHIQLDNVRTLRSAHLEAALTTILWNGRRLGKSEMVYIPNRATWLATGNNVEMSDEMARRIIPIRLDAQVERPEDRTGFRRELPGWAHENRPTLVSACLSIVRAWIDAGQPQGAATLGRYESWAAVMGGLLDVTGYQGFLQNRAQLHGAADTETKEWMAAVSLWWGNYRDRAITAGDLFEIVKEHSILLDVWGGRAKTGALQRMGHALSKKRDRVFGDYVIRSAGQDGVTRSAAYRLEFRAEGVGGTPKTTETTETPGGGVKSQVGQGFIASDGSVVLAAGAIKTTDKNTKPRENHWQKPPAVIGSLVDSVDSVVLNLPQTPGEKQEPNTGADDAADKPESVEVF
ncbi:MAG: hypothetical protein ACYCXI_07745 [Dethiobacteraceae bacterium]